MPAKPVSPIAANTSPHCSHINSRGQRCRMLPAHGSAFCAFHFRQAQAVQPDPEVLAADLLRDIEDFSTAASINAFLGNLVRQLARKRITRRDAIAFGYLSQLLLNSLPALDRQDEAEKDAEASQFLRDVLLRPRDSHADHAASERPAAPANFPS
jgi:hypothetical protein